jgi:hypothetical protein
MIMGIIYSDPISGPIREYENTELAATHCVTSSYSSAPVNWLKRQRQHLLGRKSTQVETR